MLATATAQVVYFTPAMKEIRSDGTIIETEAYKEVVNADGVRSEPKFLSNGKRDLHVEQKALTKAMRAARWQLISQAALIQAKAWLLQKQGGKPVNVPANIIPPKSANTAQNTKFKAPTQTAIQKAMNACFAMFGKKETDLAKRGVGKKDFWDALKIILGVQSRDEMTLA